MSSTTYLYLKTIDPSLLQSAGEILNKRGSTMSEFLSLQLRQLINAQELTQLYLSSKMPIGKYRGASVKEIVRNDPEYLVWLIGVSDRISFSAKVTAAIQETIAMAKAKEAQEEEEEEEFNQSLDRELAEPLP